MTRPLRFGALVSLALFAGVASAGVVAGDASAGIARATAGGNEAPLADAGLDQTVANGTTVYLDAGGSVDPDGTVTATEWTISAPDGTSVTPSCVNCTRTRFTPTRTGEYAATAAVTDDDGATRTDTLYVTVESRPGPSVSLSGPARTTVGSPTDFTVAATAGDAALRRLGWYRNGSQRANRSLSGGDADETVTRTFASPGTYRLRATVTDELGYARDATQTVRVVAAGGGGGIDRSCFHGGTNNDGRSRGDGCVRYANAGSNGRVLELGADVINNDAETIRYRHWTGDIYTIARDSLDKYRNENGWVTAEQITTEAEPISEPNRGSSGNEDGIQPVIGSGNVGWIGADNHDDSNDSSDESSGSSSSSSSGESSGSCVYWC